MEHIQSIDIIKVGHVDCLISSLAMIKKSLLKILILTNKKIAKSLTTWVLIAQLGNVHE